MPGAKAPGVADWLLHSPLLGERERLLQSRG